MNMKSSVKKIFGFFRILKISYPHIRFFLIVGSIAKACVPFVGLFFSARILNLLIVHQFQEAITAVIWMLGIELVLGIMAKACDERIDLVKVNIDDVIKQKITRKTYEIEFEQLEMRKTLDELRNADLSTRGVGGAGAQIGDLYGIFESFFSIVGSLIFTTFLFLQVKQGSNNFFASAWSMVVLILIYAIATIRYIHNNKKIAEIFNQMSKENDHVNGMLGYLIDIVLEQKNAKDVRIFQMQELLEKKLQVYGMSLKVYMKAAKKSAHYSAKNEFLGQLCAGAAYVIIGAKALYGVIPIGSVILYVGAINQVMGSLLKITQTANYFIYRAECLDAYTRFLEAPRLSYEGTLPIEKRQDGIYAFEFHDVSFSYPDSTQEILSHINLTFHVKERMAIVGQNGAGKTTLIKLLCRFYEPQSGYITLNGIDIRKYNYDEYTKMFSVVFQDFKLFSLPLGENIACEKKYDENRVMDALEKVQMNSWVNKQEDGLKTKLYHNNGNGVDVSGGEAQKCAIARALYKDAPFIILDEPTAALDPISEADIYENFNQMVENKTAIYISHRMSSCKFCDRIVVFDKGRISEEGTHRQLLDQEGIYARLFQAQAQYYQ